MLIGVVADTHMPLRAKKLPRALTEGLRGVDLILHAGDWTSPDVADMLEKISPVDGIAGNNDGSAIRDRFGRIKRLDLGGFRIGLVHGDGISHTTEQRAWNAFSSDGVDAVIFGHSHKPYLETKDGILLFNPGSPTDKRRQPLYSFGIMELGDTLSARHIYYEDKS